jgi:dihydrofolate reductase
MRKVIAIINMTLDGFCDHTAMIPVHELHQHYSDLLDTGDTILYGRKTYQLMEYWLTVLKNPTGNKSTDEFAVAIDKIQKVVFSHTLKNVETARLAKKELKEEVMELKQQKGKDIFVGSPSLILSLTQLHLIDEYQLCVHPVIAGSGLPLFKNISDKVLLKLQNVKKFEAGAIVLQYQYDSRNN